MKKLIVILILVFLSLSAMAQLEVKKGSFKEVPGFVNINTEKMYDDNDKPYAVLKIKTVNISSKERRELNFGGDAQTFFEVEYKDGEVWLYISYYATFLKISHEELSSTEFYFPFDMEPKKGYELTLINRTFQGQELTISSNWVVINVTPKNAIVNIDGNYCPNGKAMIAIDEPHKLEISHPLYHSYESTIYSDASKKMTYDVKLKPAFGFLKIDSKPEKGATVLINGVRRGVTPFLSDTLASGEYDVTLLLNMYKNMSQKLVVTDNNVTEQAITMSPNFAEVSVTTDPSSDIYIDDSQVGTGAWSGRLTEGGHIIEARKASHRNSAMSVNITSGKAETIQLPAPTPIYGALNINSEPDEATVFLDGENIGETPMIKNNVLIGEHRLVFSKEGHETLIKTANVEEGKMTNVNETLTKNASSTAKNITDTYVYQSSDTDLDGEGMWLPMFLERLNYVDMQKMGLQLTAEELYSINNTSLKDAIVGLSSGTKPRSFFCSGEIVSDKGLMFTNHHCGFSSIAALSTVEHDYLNEGFWAKSYSEELPVEGVSASFLVRMEDVTTQILSVVKDNMDWTERNNVINAKIKELEDAASQNGRFNPVIKGFFEGNEYYMFIYKTYTDVRLVGTPPRSIGNFGGDTDNWMWPRHTGDFSVFRVYADENGEPAEFSENNKPLTPKRNLTISLDGVQPNDFTMIWGFPGSTERYMTSYGINYNVDVFYPIVYEVFKAETDVMDEYMKVDKAVNIAYADNKAGLANTWKNFDGQMKMLRKNKVAERKSELEAKFTRWVKANTNRKNEYGDALSTLDAMYKQLGETSYKLFYPNFIIQQNIFDRANKFDNYLETAKNKGASKDDKQKAINELKGIDVDAMFTDLDERVERDMLVALLNIYSNKFTMSDIPEDLQALIRKHKGDMTALANTIFTKSILRNPETIKAFINKPNADLLAKDPAVVINAALREQLYSAVPAYRTANLAISEANHKFVKGLREFYAETQPDKVLYPDANSTMRMTYGCVKDYEPVDGIVYDYYSTANGIMQKYIPGDFEFDAPQRLLDLIKKKDFGQYADKNGELITCFLSANDITGGSSGSPCINNKGELIGIIFDCNWEAMSGDVYFEPELQRAINLDIRYVLFIIDKVYGATNIIRELDIRR